MGILNPKICLLGASFGTSNMGVSALTAGTIKAFFYQYPQGELFLVDYGKSEVTYNVQMGDGRMPVRLVNIRFSKRLYLKNNIALLIVQAILARLVPFSKFRKSVISRNSWLSRIADADIITSLAGGDSFSDLYGLGRFFYVSLPQLLALFLGKKLVLLPQTIGPFKSTVAKTIARFILRRASAIYSRDHTGLRETRNLIGSRANNEKVRFCYDVGFVLDPIKPDNIYLNELDTIIDERSPRVGLNVSGLLYMGGYTQDNLFGLRIDYPGFIKKLIEFLIHEKDAVVLLIPHVFGSDKNPESDSAVCQNVYAELKGEREKKLFLAGGEYDQNEIKFVIGLCDFFIGSRMHACIAALSHNIPTVPIAYSKKFIGVMDTIGVNRYVADPRVMEKDEIMRVIEEAWRDREQIRKELERKMPEVRAQVLNLFREISETLGLEN